MSFIMEDLSFNGSKNLCQNWSVSQVHWFGIRLHYFIWRGLFLYGWLDPVAKCKIRSVIVTLSPLNRYQFNWATCQEEGKAHITAPILQIWTKNKLLILINILFVLWSYLVPHMLHKFWSCCLTFDSWRVGQNRHNSQGQTRTFILGNAIQLIKRFSGMSKSSNR